MVNVGAFVRFSRPHTVVATTVQVGALFILAGGAGSLSPSVALAILATWVAALALNIYIVGLNQITDVAIDRLNKPYLPLASGAYTMGQGWGIVLATGLLALLLALFQGPFLSLTIGVALAIGTVYSLPPLRLKRHAFWAALSIAFVRGVVTTVGLTLHFRAELGAPTGLPPIIWAAALFFFGFGLVIALYKDIPDLEGDRRYTVRTFTVRLGPQRVFALGRWLLTGFYLIPIAYFLIQVPQFTAIILFMAHLLVVALFWVLSARVDPADTRSMSRFYMGLWGFFYAEYILLTLQELLPGRAV